MSDIFSKNKNWLLPLIFNVIVGAVLYFHSVSVKAAIVEELKVYVTKEELNMREAAHAQWGNEAMKRIEGSLADIKQRLERIENRSR